MDYFNVYANQLIAGLELALQVKPVEYSSKARREKALLLGNDNPASPEYGNVRRATVTIL